MLRMMMSRKRNVDVEDEEDDDVEEEDPKTRKHTVYEPARSKRTSRFHKSHFLLTCTGKMQRPTLGPERRHRLCASLRSRNACQNVTRATFYGNLQEKCRGPE